jgi:hypothetical protein
MTPEELDSLKRILKRQDDTLKELWLEKQLLRNVIIDSGWMSEHDLDAAIARGKKLPENLHQLEDNFASSNQMLAEIGIEDWLADFEKRYPNKE